MNALYFKLIQHCFLMAEIPTVPVSVTLIPERVSLRGSTVIRVSWMRPENFEQFDIDRYDISVTSTSGGH